MRPTRCQQFNCRQIIAVLAGETSETAAMEKIREARDLVLRINALINRLAETNPNRALAQRCANALTVAERSPLHDELASTMHSLEALLAKEFRIE